MIFTAFNFKCNFCRFFRISEFYLQHCCRFTIHSQSYRARTRSLSRRTLLVFFRRYIYRFDRRRRHRRIHIDSVNWRRVSLQLLQAPRAVDNALCMYLLYIGERCVLFFFTLTWHVRRPTKDYYFFFPPPFLFWRLFFLISQFRTATTETRHPPKV